MKRLFVSLFCALVLLASGSLALAADPGEAADGIADDGVFVERGASATEAEIGALVAVARNEGENLSIVVLSQEPVSGATTFADAVVDRVGRALVIVIAPESVGYAGTGDVFTVDDLDTALDAALEEGGDDADFARTFVETLTGQTAVSPDPGGSGNGGSGFIVLVVIAVVLVGGILWVLNRSRKRAESLSAERLAAARAEVQRRIDDVANDLLDLEDEVRVADNARADRFYNEAGATYREVSDALATAHTPADLIDLSNRLDVAIWQLDTAEAILDGTDFPERPEPRSIEPQPTAERTGPIDTSNLPRPSPARRTTRRSSYGSGSSMMETLLQLGMAYAAGRSSSQRSGGAPGGLGGLLGTRRSASRSSRRSSSQRSSTPRRGTGGRVRGGRRRG